MCDYSLHNVQSRPAKVGDKLVTRRFDNTTTGGFAALEDRNVAVCLLPGTEVAFDNDVACKVSAFWLLQKKVTIAERVARFRQLDMDQPDVHHDALEFPDGRVVLLTNLVKGQRATVLQLPAHTKQWTEVNAPQRFTLVD
jgi:hypothetical protein